MWGFSQDLFYSKESAWGNPTLRMPNVYLMVAHGRTPQVRIACRSAGACPQLFVGYSRGYVPCIRLTTVVDMEMGPQGMLAASSCHIMHDQIKVPARSRQVECIYAAKVVMCQPACGPMRTSALASMHMSCLSLFFYRRSHAGCVAVHYITS